MPKPVLAVINGAVSGAGMSLAFACDLRLCSSQARFKQAYTSLGLAPDVGWCLWVGLLAGFSKAAEMVFLDPVYSADQALAMGLVHRVVEPEKLEEATRAWTEQLAAGATYSFACAKADLNHAFLTLLERQLEVERKGVLEASTTSDYQEGLKAFRAKRNPTSRVIRELRAIDSSGGIFPGVLVTMPVGLMGNQLLTGYRFWPCFCLSCLVYQKR